MRTEHWDVKLAQWAHSRLGTPFAWGQTDCGILAMEALDVLIGGEHANAHRGRYDSLKSCIVYQLDTGFTVRVALEQACCIEIAHGFQQRGDFILTPWGDFWGCVVCLGRESLGVEEGGMVEMVPTAAVLANTGSIILRAD